MVTWEDYRWWFCKCNDFNVHGVVGRDTQPFDKMTTSEHNK